MSAPQAELQEHDKHHWNHPACSFMRLQPSEAGIITFMTACIASRDYVLDDCPHHVPAF
jgi:hypothetical protein